MSTFRIIGFNDYNNEKPMSWSSRWDAAKALEKAKEYARQGFIVLAIMPESESIAIRGSDEDKAKALHANMRKAIANDWIYMDTWDKARPIWEEWLTYHPAPNGESSERWSSTVGPRKPIPQICPEVWVDKKKFEKVDYMAAIHAMCKGE